MFFKYEIHFFHSGLESDYEKMTDTLHDEGKHDNCGEYNVCMDDSKWQLSNLV